MKNLIPLKPEHQGITSRRIGAVMETRYWLTDQGYAAIAAFTRCPGRHCAHHQETTDV